MEMQQLRYVVAVARTGKEGHCLGDQVLRFCDRREVRPNISLRSAQLETVQALVRAGLGLSLIPAMAAQSERDDLPDDRSLSDPTARSSPSGPANAPRAVRQASS
jgi:DNA-binding transcriptional LysR family regulator